MYIFSLYYQVILIEYCTNTYYRGGLHMNSSNGGQQVFSLAISMGPGGQVKGFIDTLSKLHRALLFLHVFLVLHKLLLIVPT